MTWHYVASGSEIQIYDHMGTRVVTAKSFSGAWSRTPDVVYEVMANEARQAAESGNLQYAAAVFADGVADDIQEGEP
jgi:hypothetical protein